MDELHPCKKCLLAVRGSGVSRSSEAVDWDHLVSFVIVTSRDFGAYERAIERLVADLGKRFKFFEILLIISKKNDSSERLLGRLVSLAPYTRLLIVDGYSGFDDLMVHGFRECIGDIVVMAAAEELEFLELGQLVDPIIAGSTVLRMKRPNNTIAGWLGSKLLRVITGFRVDTRFYRTLSVSRQALTELLTSPERLVFFRFTAARGIAGYKVIRVDRPRPRQRLGERLKRIDLGARLVMTAAPRLLRYAAILCALLSLSAFLGLFYSLGVWAFKSEVIEGWTSTTLLLGFWMFTQLGATSILCLGLSRLLDRNTDRADGTIVEEIASGDLFANASFLNVEPGEASDIIRTTDLVQTRPAVSGKGAVLCP